MAAGQEPVAVLEVAGVIDQVNAAFRKYVDPAKLAAVYAGDWTKK